MSQLVLFKNVVARRLDSSIILAGKHVPYSSAMTKELDKKLADAVEAVIARTGRGPGAAIKPRRAILLPACSTTW